MAYTPKPGSISLFANDRKTQPSQPDLRGDGMLPDGTLVWASAWRKQGKKGEWISLQLNPKDEAPAAANLQNAPPKGKFDDLADDIPF